MSREWWLEPPQYQNPICPVCGEECETLYVQDGSVIGCDSCVSTKDAQEYWDEYEDQFSHKGF